VTDIEIGRGKQAAIYDPVKGLKIVAVAEAGEKHWRRAKDPRKLFEAIKSKIVAQADYVVWRDGVVVPSQKQGKQKKQADGISVQKSQKSALPAADPGDVTAHRWRKKLCYKGKTGTVRDKDKMKLALQDAMHRSWRICEQEPGGTERGTLGTGEFERYTPEKYIEAARKVLGEIDLDPCTSKQAQKIVKAKHYFTEKDDGLAQEWHGRIFMNPPYHRDLAPKFITKLVAELKSERAVAAILLTNNSTDTDWFDEALKACTGICFTHGRIKFYVPEGPDVLPTQGQTFFYFGDDVQRFEDVFCVIGPCLRPSREYANGQEKHRVEVG